MSKKLIIACMALVSLAAFALPAVASAANKPTLVETPTSTETLHVEPGSKIISTNSGETFFWNTGATTKQVTCNKAVMTGTVLKNSEGTIEGEITSSIFQGTGAISADNNLPECTGSFGNAYVTVSTPMCIRSTPVMAEDEFQVTGGKCGTEGKVTFTIGSTTVGACKYLSTGPVKGTFTTNETETTLTVTNTNTASGAELEEGGFFCPSSGQLQMSFHLWTDTKEGTEGTKIGAVKAP
ncbi:MAG TPA: hypothetical protein VFN85_02520 [Solirubrobacterales bacterium]|nr:hypothetical protein [Solirubrobacterales bacterium]